MMPRLAQPLLHLCTELDLFFVYIFLFIFIFLICRAKFTQVLLTWL